MEATGGDPGRRITPLRSNLKWSHHALDPDPERQRTSPDAEQQDQSRFDAGVQRFGRVALGAAGGLGVLAALAMSTIAMVDRHAGPTTTVVVRTPAAAVTAPAPAAAAAAPISLTVAGGNKKGPDGKMHDSYSKTDFAVTAGQPLTLNITNKDDAPHSITSPAAGVDIIVKPGTHTYTLTVAKSGRFFWYCKLPCDDWAMKHAGFMAGYITAT
ncbi:hypothetical protein FSW04_10885 [Baekduia soli]|uniref:EfeO-type cupredoxin-like domain-containing protein n=1 Tax=Baekduia soli TaxID=496014 RepID=A0A5B8U568_9ACTN|nr:cupredoxin domain-containing protein [Baekduia soli]QEC48025.1 hypothetical protein FSW04_10885 [Baekduia soli]